MKPSRCDRRACEIVRDFLVGLAVFFAFFTLAMLDSRALRSAPAVFPKPAATAQSQTLSRASVTTGTLFLVAPEIEEASDTTDSLRRAPLLDTDINITVTGPIARTIITQKFRNSSGVRVEGIYAFPLPQLAIADALTMRLGKRIVKSEIMPRTDARKIYRIAKDAGMKASPLSPYGSNIFTSSLAHIAPGEEVTIRMEYQERLQRKDDAYSLRVPLVVAPQYALKPGVHVVSYNGPTARNIKTSYINPVTLNIRLDSGFPLDRVTSSTHEIAVTRDGENSALIAFMRGRVRADRDFELRWKSKASAIPGTAVFRENKHDGAYVLTMLAPPKIEAVPAPIAREVVFVVGTSGSMAGTSILQMKESLTLAIKRLKPEDRFNIIHVSSSFEELFDGPVAVTRESVEIATKFISKMRAASGSNMLEALGAALKDKRKKDHGRVRQIVLVSDGVISNEAELFSQLAAKRGRSKLFMVGLGSAPNGLVMRRAAEIGRGSYFHIGSASQMFERMNSLFQQLERPIITDLKLEWAAGLRADAWPNPLPDLYAGEPMLIAARLPALKGNLMVTGKISGKPWKRTISLPNAPEGAGIAKFWAQEKIASLEARSYSGQTMSDVNAAIEAVALEHHLVSRMTSLVSVDATPDRPEDQPLASEELPVNLPAGWIYGTPGVAKTSAAGVRMSLLSESSAPAKHQINPPASDGKQAGSTKPVSAISKLALKNTKRGLNKLPVARAPSISDRSWMIAVMAIFFATMTALTLGLWRHLRNSVSPKRGREV